MSSPSLRDRLATGELLLIDGATGTELERRGVPMHDQAWCGLTPVTHADTIRLVHDDYIRAGSQVITSDTFGSSKHVLEDSGLGDRFREINQAGIRVAREAADQAEVDHPVWVGGSICTSFVAGNEIKPVDPQRARDGFREQMDILLEGGADLLMLEMVLAHVARVGIDITVDAVEAAVATGLPVWVGISTQMSKDQSTVLLLGGRDPYNLDPDAPDVTSPLDERILPVLEAGADVVGIMHSDTSVCAPALDILRELWSGPLAAYPHSGHWENPYWNFDSVIGPEGFAEHAQTWIERGAQVIGGCCGIGPEHIALLHERYFD